MPADEKPSRLRQWSVHGLRLGLLAVLIGLIHIQHTRITAQQVQGPVVEVPLGMLRPFYPTAHALGEVQAHGGREVLNAAGDSLGYVLQTSPESDQIIGFSGPTNVLIAFSSDDIILGIEVLSSADTKEHVAQVLQDQPFLDSFKGQTWDQANSPGQVDGVSGATLTSLAMRESVAKRLGGGLPSLRFPDPLTVETAQRLFPEATRVEEESTASSFWNIYGESEALLGQMLGTSPAADQIIGYQGPTQAWVGFDPAGKIIGLTLGKSYDNEPYVGYVRDEEYFLTLFNDLVLEELAELDLVEHGVEGVSGATMTSMAVSRGMVEAAQRERTMKQQQDKPKTKQRRLPLAAIGTAVVVLAAIAIGFTKLRAYKYLRIAFNLVLIGYLGLVNGDMISQAMLVGWAKNGVPSLHALGLMLLTAAAFLLPIATKRNLYCSHICPHGAAQQMLMHVLPWRWHMPARLSRLLRLLPAVLLGWVVLVAMLALPFSLIGIEPFDAWVFQIAGVATITVAIVGLVASLFVPMAYCRYGCPTGALLNYVRFNARSDRWTSRDWFALSLVVFAGIVLMLPT